VPDVSSKRKPLGKDLWITLKDGSQVKIDYPSRGQRGRYRELMVQWNFGTNSPDEDHYLGYWVRCCIRAVRGFKIDGKEAKVEIVHKEARELKTDDESIDVLDYLEIAGMLEEVTDHCLNYLEFSELDKKKLQLHLTSFGQAPSQPSQPSSEVAPESLTDGGPLEKMEENDGSR